MALKQTIERYNKKIDDTSRSLERDPFSDTYRRPGRLSDAEGYGRPAAGSATERRGIKAGNYVMREVVFLCEIISKYAATSESGAVEIKFGPLFNLYATYSDKVVGMLLRARKHGLVAFEGEMLYQRQDDDKIITLLKPIDEIKNSIGQSGDPKSCISST